VFAHSASAAEKQFLIFFKRPNRKHIRPELPAVQKGNFYPSVQSYGWDNNEKHLKELEHDDIKYNPEFTAHFGGPIIKEKLFFFLAGSYTERISLVFEVPVATLWKMLHFQLKSDWILNTKNTVSFMVNYDPFKHENLGFRKGEN